jgi:hypothetical protein
MTEQGKKNLDVLLPLLLTVAVGWFYFRRYPKNWQGLLAVCGATFLASWVAVSRITRSILDAAPGRVKLPSDVSLDSCNGWDAAALTRLIKEDTYAPWYTVHFRNLDAYQQLLALDNCRFVKVYNYWNSHFYQDNKESIRQAINSESTWLDSGFSNLVDSLNKRFASLNLN